MLLSAFSLFLLAGLGQIGKQIIVAFCGYFSTTRRMERSVLFYISKHNRLTRLFHFKKARLHYMNQQKRKRLLKRDNLESISS